MLLATWCTPRLGTYTQQGCFVRFAAADLLLHACIAFPRPQAQLKMLQAEQPDLVVFSGDMVDGPSWNGRRGWYESVWQRLIKPVNFAGVPYASILGNHDGEADLSRRDIVELDMRTSNLTLTQQGPHRLTGAGNYYLDVLSSDGEQVAARLWMLDSNNRGCEHVRHGWCVGPGQRPAGGRRASVRCCLCEL